LAFLQYFTSDKLALRASGAKVVTREQAPELHDMVERLAAMGDPPKPSASATGRSPKTSVVAVTEGLWRRLEPREVEGVIAHELTHISNRDVTVMTIASFFAMVAAMLTRIALYTGL